MSRRYGATVTGGGLASCSMTLNFFVGRAVGCGEAETDAAGTADDPGGAEGRTDTPAATAASARMSSSTRSMALPIGGKWKAQVIGCATFPFFRRFALLMSQQPDIDALFDTVARAERDAIDAERRGAYCLSSDDALAVRIHQLLPVSRQIQIVQCATGSASCRPRLEARRSAWWNCRRESSARIWHE